MLAGVLVLVLTLPFRQVLQYEFLPGTHVASDSNQFACLAANLRRLHEQGFVHGDVRGSNVVFNVDAPCTCEEVRRRHGVTNFSCPYCAPVQQALLAACSSGASASASTGA